MAAQYPMKRAVLELVIDETNDRFIIPIKNTYQSVMRDDDVEMRFTVGISIQDLEGLTKPPPEPPYKKTTDEDAILAAVNESPLLKIMIWRDFLTENGADEGLIFGLNWLIEHKKVPIETEYSDWETERPTRGTQKTSYYWLPINAQTTPMSGGLPQAIHKDIETIILPDYYAPQVIPTQFPTIAEAYRVAALAIWDNRTRLEAASVGIGTGAGPEDDYNDDVDWDAPEPEDE